MNQEKQQLLLQVHTILQEVCSGETALTSSLVNVTDKEHLHASTLAEKGLISSAVKNIKEEITQLKSEHAKLSTLLKGAGALK